MLTHTRSELRNIHSERSRHATISQKTAAAAESSDTVPARRVRLLLLRVLLRERDQLLMRRQQRQHVGELVLLRLHHDFELDHRLQPRSLLLLLPLG